jgi:uncharacterized membrane protein
VQAMVIIATLVLLFIAPHLAWPATPGYTIHQITYPKSGTTSVIAINDRLGARGDVVGSYTAQDFSQHAFVKWGSTYLTVPGFSPACSPMTGLNNARVLIGYACAPNPLETGVWIESFVHVGASKEHAETRTDIIAIPGASETLVYGINDAEALVGVYKMGETPHAFLLVGDTPADLPPVEGWEVWPSDINNHGQIVGTVYQPETGISYGFFLDEGDYQFFGHPASTFFSVNGLNDHGHIVGAYWVTEWETAEMSCCWRGYLFKNGRFTTINATKDAQTAPKGINNAGNIAGTFFRPLDEEINGAPFNWLPHGFIAAPKPLPKPKKPAKVAPR